MRTKMHEAEAEKLKQENADLKQKLEEPESKLGSDTQQKNKELEEMQQREQSLRASVSNASYEIERVRIQAEEELFRKEQEIREMATRCEELRATLAKTIENGKHEVEPILQEATKTKQALEEAKRKNNQLEEALANVRKELEEERSKIHESTLQVEYWKRRYESLDSGLHQEQNQSSLVHFSVLELEKIQENLSTVESRVFRMPLDARLELIDKDEGVGNLSIVESEDILRELHAVAPKILPNGLH